MKATISKLANKVKYPFKMKGPSNYIYTIYKIENDVVTYSFYGKRINKCNYNFWSQEFLTNLKNKLIELTNK
jgi:hypothetical protein